MQDIKEMKKQKIINTILCINIFLVIVIILLLIMSRIIFQNEQRRIAHDENQFLGMSIAECEEILGDSLINYGSEAYFDGGSTYKLEFGSCLRYREYRLRVFFDEDGCIRSVREEKTLDLIL